VVLQNDVAGRLTDTGPSGSTEVNDTTSSGVSAITMALAWGSNWSRPAQRSTDDRCPAGDGLEQANTGRPSRPRHVVPGNDQGKTLAAVESEVFGRRQVMNAFDVPRPND
jgi:hypothetical protein